MRKLSLTLLTLVAVACLATTAFADNLVFDLSPANGFTSRSAGNGIGQGVDVSTTQTINDMQFFLNLPNGGDLKFFIFNGTNDSLLYLQEETGIAASQNPAWISSPEFNFTLQAGSTYYFGVIADNDASIGYIFPPINYSNNGLTARTDGNSNYSGYGEPVFSGNGSAEAALRLGTSPVPEPGSMMLMGTGVLGLAGVLRRKLML